MTRVLVTGGAGRLGRSVVESLATAGHDVISVDRHSVVGLDARQVEHDLTDPDATRELFAELSPQSVVHLAAIPVPFSSPDAHIFATNTGLAFGVLDAALAAGATSVLMASSPTVVGYGVPGGWTPDYLPIDEEHRLAPWNGYALSKQSVESLVAMAVRRYGDRARFGAFRPCFVIAPEEWHGAPTQQGHSVHARLDDASLSSVALFNYIDARDAGDFVAAWVDRVTEIPNGEIFFVSASDSLVRGSVSEALAELVPDAAALSEGLTPDAAVFSSEKAERLLGWRARRSWRDELAETDPTTQEARHA